MRWKFDCGCSAFERRLDKLGQMWTNVDKIVLILAKGCGMI